MRKMVILAAIAVIAGAMLTGCKSSKPSVQKGSKEIEVPSRFGYG